MQGYKENAKQKRLTTNQTNDETKAANKKHVHEQTDKDMNKQKKKQCLASWEQFGV